MSAVGNQLLKIECLGNPHFSGFVLIGLGGGQ